MSRRMFQPLRRVYDVYSRQWKDVPTMLHEEKCHPHILWLEKETWFNPCDFYETQHAWNVSRDFSSRCIQIWYQNSEIRNKFGAKSQICFTVLLSGIILYRCFALKYLDVHLNVSFLWYSDTRSAILSICQFRTFSDFRPLLHSLAVLNPFSQESNRFSKFHSVTLDATFRLSDHKIPDTKKSLLRKSKKLFSHTMKISFSPRREGGGV